MPSAAAATGVPAAPGTEYTGLHLYRGVTCSPKKKLLPPTRRNSKHEGLRGYSHTISTRFTPENCALLTRVLKAFLSAPS